MGVVSVFLFHIQLSGIPVWSIFPTFGHSPVIDSVAYYFLLMIGTGECLIFPGLALGLDSGCAPEFQE